MVRTLVFVALFACRSPDANQPPAPPAPAVVADAAPAPACTRTLKPEGVYPVGPQVRQLVTLDAHRLVVAVVDHAETVGGLFLYDTTHAEAAPRAYSVPGVIDFAMRGDRIAVFATPAGISTLDLVTGCLHEPPKPVVAVEHVIFDIAHDRAFVTTAHTLARIDLATLAPAAEVPRPDDLVELGYDPTSDRLVARTYTATVRLYDPATLAASGTFELDHPPVAGPWIRRRHAEALFGYELYCEHHKAVPKDSMRVPCLDPPSTRGGRLVRVALPAGAVIATIPFGDPDAPGGVRDNQASWSGDGNRMFMIASWDAMLVDVTATGSTTQEQFSMVEPTTAHGWEGGSFGWPFALDATGEHYASTDGSTVRIGVVASGAITWHAPIPQRILTNTGSGSITIP